MDVVQIADNCPTHMLSVLERTKVKQKSQEYGIKIELGVRGMDMEKLKMYLQLCIFFNSKILRVLPDFSVETESSCDYESILMPIRELLPEFKKADIKIAVENYEKTPTEDLLRIVNEINDPYFGICFDTANLLGIPETPETAIDALAPYVVNVHLKDFDIKRAEQNQGFIIRGCPLGRGKLNLKKILEYLNSKAGDISFILELWVPLSGSLEETIQVEEEWASMSVQYAQELFRTAGISM
ncbi:MAG: sugar phosphate isomerase/epimerase [Pseudothermotoga sp.]|nr:sugar phosphate isomerase/epimerase [Pseudothermotoga sp.]MDW8140526.1 TIM barrel protein [Pseudothermotoga sp.]